MTDEKQIEEIANAMCLFCKEMTEENKCERGAECYEWRLKEASCYYQQGIRKIPEGAVVLTVEEIERLKKNITDFDTTFIKHFEETIRKETAREIFDKLRDAKRGFYINFSLMEEYEFNGILNDVEKELGVEVE